MSIICHLNWALARSTTRWHIAYSRNNVWPIWLGLQQAGVRFPRLIIPFCPYSNYFRPYKRRYYRRHKRHSHDRGNVFAILQNNTLISFDQPSWASKNTTQIRLWRRIEQRTLRTEKVCVNHWTTRGKSYMLVQFRLVHVSTQTEYWTASEPPK